MTKTGHLLVAIFLVVLVAVVFFAPSADLEPSALRASQAARALLLALVSAALTLSVLLRFACFCFLREGSESPLPNDGDLITLNCARLC